MPLHPQTAALLESIATSGQVPLERQDPVSARAERAALVKPSMIEIGEVRDLDAGGVGARLYRPAGDPDEPTGLLIWFHGGGWVLGSLDGHDDMCRHLCRDSGQRVLSIDYRLAPEHPFPAALTDALHAVRWAADHAVELDADPERLAVGGDSAGANLAAVVGQLQPTPLRLQVLVYPVTDARCGTESYRENADGYFLTASSMEWFIEHYLSGGRGSRDDPRVSPLLADDAAVAASPPSLVLTAEYDPLRDEGRAYAERLASLGVPTTHVLFHGQVHAFFTLAEFIDDAHLARSVVAEAVSRALSGPARSPE